MFHSISLFTTVGVLCCNINPDQNLKFLLTLKVYYKPKFILIIFWKERMRVMFSRVMR